MFKSVLLFSIPLVCLLISCGQVSAGLAGIFPDKLSERSYEEINGYLEKLPNISPEVDLSKTLRWLGSRLASVTFPAERDSLLMALNQLNGLETLRDDVECDLESFKMLQANNQSTKGAAYKDDQEFDSTSRIDQLVHYYFKEHAKSCKGKYLSLFKSKVEQMDSKQVVKVETMRDGFIEAILLHLKKYISRTHEYPLIWNPETFPKNTFETSFIEVKQLIRTDNSLAQLSNLMDLFEFLSQFDSDRKWLKARGKEVNYNEVKTLYERHIASPCKYYVDKLSGLNQMFAFDNHIISMYPEDQHSELAFDLYQQRAGYILCKDLLQEPLLNHFINIMAKSDN